MGLSDGGQHAGQDLQPQVFFVAESISAPLKDADLVVETLHETERDLVLGPAVGGNPVPMSLDHRGKLLIGGQALPAEGFSPVVEEPTGPFFVPVIPQLLERFLQQVGRIQPFVGLQQPAEVGSPGTAQVFPARQQSIFLSLDVAPVLSRQPGIFASPDQVEGLAQMPQNMKLVEQNGGLGSILSGRFGESLPHIHDPQPNTPTGLQTQLFEELVQALLGPILPSEPDGPPSNQIADDDPVDMTFAQGDFVDADDARLWRRMTSELLPHVLHLEGFDRAPVETEFLGHILDGRTPAAAADVEREAFGIERIVGQKGQFLLFHGAATPAQNSSDLHLQKNSGVAAGLVPDPPDLAVVPYGMNAAAASANCFFSLRTSVITRAPGSPKIPLTVEFGRKPGNRYSSDSRRRCRLDRMKTSYRFSDRPQKRRNLYSMRSPSLFYPGFTHLLSR
jgi:hypothetical protein